MNHKEMEKIEKQLQKTHHVFKKNKASTAKIKALTSFARSLTPEQLIIFIAKFIIGVSGTVHKKKLIKMINDSVEPDMGIDVDLLLEELSLYEETPLKLRDLLKGS